MGKNDQLNDLFEHWPGAQETDFHLDGIINEPRFSIERRRILYIMAEPSSRGPMFAHLLGQDIRSIYNNDPPIKPLTQNTALWSEVLLDGRREYIIMRAEAVQDGIRRSAIINLGKQSGTGRADYKAIRESAERDRNLIEQQINIIDPHTIVSCGERISKILKDILPANMQNKTIHTYHLSCRPSHAPAAFQRIVSQTP